jgi:hypothetical protein
MHIVLLWSTCKYVSCGPAIEDISLNVQNIHFKLYLIEKCLPDNTQFFNVKIEKKQQDGADGCENYIFWNSRVISLCT